MEPDILDSKFALAARTSWACGARQAAASPRPRRMQGTFVAGVVQQGVAASDPSLLPLGSVVELDSGEGGTTASTLFSIPGPVQGREIDVYLLELQRGVEVRTPACPAERAQVAGIPSGHAEPARPPLDAAEPNRQLPARPLPSPSHSRLVLVLKLEELARSIRAPPSSSWCVPDSRTTPLCSTRILSISWIVDRRCAMAIVVRPVISTQYAPRGIRISVSVSTLDVASVVPERAD